MCVCCDIKYFFFTLSLHQNKFENHCLERLRIFTKEKVNSFKGPKGKIKTYARENSRTKGRKRKLQRTNFGLDSE